MTSIAPRPISVDPASVHREVMPNGLTVLVRRDATAPVVAIVTHVKAGYFDETDDVVGIAHVLEHMFFKGTPTRGVGEIAKETKANGGYLNASTIYDHTVYYTVLPSSGLLAGLEIQADAYARSVIDADELARELEVIIQEAKRKADNPSAVANETLYEVLHDRHRMRRWRIGREDGLRRLTRADLVRFYRNFYRPSTTILSIVGDLDVDETLRHVTRLYGDLPSAPVERTPGPAEGKGGGFRYRELSGDVAQAQLAFGWRTPGTLHDDTAALDVAAATLGVGRASRLYRAVRERQLASSVSAYNYTPTELGVFVVHAEAPADTMVAAAQGVWGQVRSILDAGVSAPEVERAQRVFESRWLRQLESMEGQANHLAEWEALGDWQLGDRYFERTMSVTAAEVTDVVRRYVTPDQAGLVVYRPASAAEVAASPAAARAVLDGAVPAPVAPIAIAEAPAAPTIAHRVALEREEAGVRVYRGAGGVPVLVRRRPGSPIVHLGVFTLGGASAEPESLSGMSTLMAATTIKGTERRTADRIAEESEMLGGAIATSVSSDGLGWSFSVPVPRLAAAIDLLADVVQRPAFDPAALETERSVALANVAQLRDDMYRYPVRLASQAAYAGHPYARSPLGSEPTLAAVTVEAVRGWHRDRVLASPSVIALVGDVDPDEAAVALTAAFTTLAASEATPPEPPRWPDGPRTVAESREKAQTALALGFESPARRDRERFTAGLIAGVASGLGGRFFDELRDRQSLAYTVQAYASDRLHSGMFLSYIATSPEKEERARRGLLDQFARLRDELVTDEELERAKRYAIGTHAIRQESGGAVLGDVVDAWLYGGDLRELDDYEANLTRVTATQMRALARRYFDERRRVEGLVRGVGKTV